ncbi:MAG: hypothetical protein M0R77_00645 [Gammaproteobacteria bacterium]|nr:hypothetical protein [Gammaproteobacteria bacterium]
MSLPDWTDDPLTPLSIGDIRDEWGATFGNPRLSWFYANGPYVDANAKGYPFGVETNIPTSGRISISNFYGSAADVAICNRTGKWATYIARNTNSGGLGRLNPINYVWRGLRFPIFPFLTDYPAPFTSTENLIFKTPDVTQGQLALYGLEDANVVCIGPDDYLYINFYSYTDHIVRPGISILNPVTGQFTAYHGQNYIENMDGTGGLGGEMVVYAGKDLPASGVFFPGYTYDGSPHYWVRMEVRLRRRNDTFAWGNSAGLMYRGEHNENNVISYSGISSLVGFNSGTLINNKDSGWLKVTLNNKELYVAKKNVRRNVTLSQLNAANLVTGNRTVTVRGVNYRIRLLTASEWVSLFPPLSRETLLGYSGVKLAQFEQSEFVRHTELAQVITKGGYDPEWPFNSTRTFDFIRNYQSWGGHGGGYLRPGHIQNFVPGTGTMYSSRLLWNYGYPLASLLQDGTARGADGAQWKWTISESEYWAEFEEGAIQHGIQYTAGAVTIPPSSPSPIGSGTFTSSRNYELGWRPVLEEI